MLGETLGLVLKPLLPITNAANGNDVNLKKRQISKKQMDTIDPNRCPICHEPNVCAVEKAKLPGGKPERCWCMDAVFTPDVMNQVPDAAKGKACICAKCAGGVA